MRAVTILVLLGLIVLFAFFGWRAFGIVALTFLLVLVLALGTVAAGLWVIKRRMRRKLEELRQVLATASARTASVATPPERDDVIDVEGQVRKPRDGADKPDDP